MKPLILLPPLYDDARESIWMLPNYSKCVRDAGGWTLTLDLCADDAYLQEVVSLASGILLTGGHDVSPNLYGEPAMPVCGPDNDVRDQMDMKLLQMANQHNIPTLGICRGLQLMNVFFGGSLIQDIPTESPSFVEHKMSAPYDRTTHDIEISSDSLLHRIIGSNKLSVNSYHHQGIKRLGTSLTAVGSTADGLIEAIEHRGHDFMLGVQWHPEYFSDKPGEGGCAKLFGAFVEASMRHREAL